MVQPGYSRCPRCKMPQRGPGSVDGRKTQGGTAVGVSSSRTTFIALGLLALVVGVVVIAGRGGDDDSQSELPASTEVNDAPTVEPPATPTTSTSSGTGEPVGFTGRDPEPVAAPGRTTTLRSLETELGKKRFWSTVSVDQATSTIITVSSSSCTEPAMKGTLTDTGPQLRAVGFVSLRCVAKHGGLVFEIEL